jgi:hypothetical protein
MSNEKNKLSEEMLAEIGIELVLPIPYEPLSYEAGYRDALVNYIMKVKNLEAELYQLKAELETDWPDDQEN